MLIGRTTELKQLNHYYEQDENSLVIVYGQIGVGINDFLGEYLSDKSVRTFCARAGSEREQLYLWAKELRSQGVEIESYPDFSMLFSAFNNVNEKELIVWVQEFQYLVKNGSTFMDELVAYLGNRWNRKKTKVILSSSCIGWIENDMVSKIKKAAFSISGFIKLKPLGFLDVVCTFEHYSTKDCIITYGVLGGIEQYWKCFDNEKSVTDNICEQILTPSAYLYEEGRRYLFHELREDSVYNTILASLAEGKNKLHLLHLHTGFSRAKLSVYLKNLIELNIVEKVYSYETSGWINAQKGVYRICHPFMRFYFRYIYPNMTDLNQMSKHSFYDKYIASDEKNYYGEYFIKVCREYLSILNDRNMLPFHYSKSGEWIGKVGNVDIITQDDEQKTLIGMCNWEKELLCFEDYEWFMFCVKEAKLKPQYIYLFSVGGFDEKIKELANSHCEIVLVDMQQL